MTPDDETINWTFEASKWWIENLGGFRGFSGAMTLVTPTETDFPVDGELSGDALAQDYFAFAKEHAGLAEWPLRLVVEQTPNVADALRGMPHHLTSAPTRDAEPVPLEEGDPLDIPYDPADLAEPTLLVATIARGMSHYLFYDVRAELPESTEECECFIDLGAVFLGFGIFLANSAFRFVQSEEGLMAGWGFSRRGVLSELDISYALAIAGTLLEVPNAEVVPHLSPNPKGFYKSASKHLVKKRRADLDRLRAIEAPAGGPYR